MATKDIDKAPPALAVFGMDLSTRAHGSYFSQDEVDRAIKAANDMGLDALRIDSDELAAIAAKLPRGKLFESGNAFVPFVGRGAFDALVAAGKAAGDRLLRPAIPLADRPAKPARAAATAPAGQSKREPVPNPPYSLPTTWDDIGVGSLVLIVEALEDGYFPAIVQAVGVEPIEERQLQAVFRDHPDYEQMTKKVTEVALIHPASTSHLP